MRFVDVDRYEEIKAMKERGKKFSSLGTALKPVVGVMKKIGGFWSSPEKSSPTRTETFETPLPPIYGLKTISKDVDSCFALLVGVDEYKALGNLNYASSDAEALERALLELGFPKENIWRCISGGSRGEQPTKKNIDGAIKDLLDAAGPRSTIFIALSGHGFETQDGKAAFCPKDVVCSCKGENTTTVTKESAILIDELTEKLRAHPAEFKMMIVDACRLPAQAKSVGAGLGRAFGTIDPSGIAFLQSCSSGEASFEDAELQKSVFTHYFIEGLKGKAESRNGGVTFLHVCSYASDQTQKRVQKIFKKTQTPYYKIDGVDFVLKEATRNVADELYREGRALAWGLDGTKIDGFRALDLLTQAANAGLSDAKAALALLYYDGCEATPPDYKKAIYWASRADAENPIAQNVLGDCYKDGLGVRKDEEEAKRLHKAAFEGFQELAKNGDDALILNQLARCYFNKRGTKLDFAAAVKYHRRAAELRCAVGVSNLAGTYCFGCGVKRDYAKAIQLYNEAIELNCSFAYSALGDCYREGIGVPRDYAKAIELYRQAAKKNYAEGYLGEGVCYERGWGVERDPEKAVQLFSRAADLNNSNATAWLGGCYYYGNGVEQDRCLAWDLWNRAAEQDNWGAFSWVAACYRNGWGTVKNEERAERWFARIFQLSSEYAEAGAPYAICWLGDCYYNGYGVEQNYAEAMRWYRIAEEKGETAASGKLGVCYYLGLGVKRDFEAAIKCFRRADELGWLEAKSWLGECYYYGHGVEKDYGEAIRLYRDAAEKNVVYAMNGLGICYYWGHGVELDYDEAARWFRRAADFNYNWGFFNLGNCYYYGHGFEQDYKKAVELYNRAADLECVEATQQLGICYFEGNGVEQDYPTAIRYFRDAAAQGNARACCYLGYCYGNGVGVWQNDEEAVKWFRKGDELQDAEATTLLGERYALGSGVEQDVKKAASLYRKAAEAGFADAMNRLAICCFNGDGVKKNKKEASAWWRKAADLNYAVAAMNLGFMYDGEDEAEATRWFCRAAELGELNAAAIAGERYMLGAGVERDWSEALKYWRAAVEAENQRALRGLGKAAVWQKLSDAEEKWNVVLGKVSLSELPSEITEAFQKIGDKIGFAQGLEYLEKAEKLGDGYSRLLLGICRFYGVGVEQDFEQAKRLFRLAAINDDEDAKIWFEWADAALENWSEKVAKMNAWGD